VCVCVCHMERRLRSSAGSTRYITTCECVCCPVSLHRLSDPPPHHCSLESAVLSRQVQLSVPSYIMGCARPAGSEMVFLIPLSPPHPPPPPPPPPPPTHTHSHSMLGLLLILCSSSLPGVSFGQLVGCELTSCLIEALSVLGKFTNYLWFVRVVHTRHAGEGAWLI